MNRKLILVGVLLLFVGIVLYSVIFGNKGGFNWQVHYKNNSKDPYGLLALKNILKAQASVKNWIEIDKKTSTQLGPEANGSYVVVGEALYLDSADVQSLISFVSRGNTAFISTQSVPFDLMFFLYHKECPNPYNKLPSPTNDDNNYDAPVEDTALSDSMYETTVPEDIYNSPPETNPETDNLVEDETDYTPSEYNHSPGFNGATLPWTDYEIGRSPLLSFSFIQNGTPKIKSPNYFYRQGTDTITFNYSYINEQYFCNDANGLQALGYLNEDVNFARVKVGEGYFYLHTSPIQFTNLHLIDSLRATWSSRYWSVLPKTGNLYWDTYCITPESFSRNRNQDNQSQVQVPEQNSPLTVLLSNPPVARGWYALLLALGLFVWVYARRKQRAVPVLPKVENDSLGFVRTVAALHYGLGDHRAMISQLKQTFLRKMMRRFSITPAAWAKIDAATLSNRSSVAESLCAELIIQLNVAERNGDVHSLVALHKAIEAFEKSNNSPQ